MCCRGERCFRINCHCVCYRCRNCELCERTFGQGGLGDALAGGALSRLAEQITHRRGPQGCPLPPPPLDLTRPPPSSRQGQHMVSAVHDNCAVQ